MFLSLITAGVATQQCDQMPKRCPQVTDTDSLIHTQQKYFESIEFQQASLDKRKAAGMCLQYNGPSQLEVIVPILEPDTNHQNALPSKR